MRELKAFGRWGALGGWRHFELLALVATIPAFYMQLLVRDRLLATLLYLAACAASATVVWRETGRDAWRSDAGAAFTSHRLGILMSVGLLLSAVLPAGAAPAVLSVRLITAALIVLRTGESLRPWFWRGGLPYLLTVGVGVMGLCGLGFWWLEPRAPTFGDGLWLAFTTASTVGYGDIVPSTPASKIFAVFVVLLGVAVLSMVTAAIAAIWVQTEERKIEREMLRDLHRELRAIRDELAALRGPRQEDAPIGAELRRSGSS